VNGRARRLVAYLGSTLWFVPGVMVVGALLLAYGLIELDRRLAWFETSDKLPWIFHGGANSARDLLSAIASSSITVMGVVFSITIVALTLASTQFTPRVLRNFMRDRGNQVVIGILTGTYAYAMLVMRSVRSVDEGTFVPTIAVTAGLLLALVTTAAIIYFINHMAESIQAASIIHRAAEATKPLLVPRYPEEFGTALPHASAPSATGAAVVAAPRSGYVRYVDGDELLAIAGRHDLVLCMDMEPGDFVLEGAPLALVHPELPVESTADAIRSAVVLGQERSLQQDAEFGMRQIMDIAVKALSPGINDPTTAVTCVDQLAALLARAAAYPDPTPCRGDGKGRLRLVLRGQTFESMCGHALDQIRQHAGRDVAVTLRLIRLFELVGGVTPDEGRRDILWWEACMVAASAERNVMARHDRDDVNAALRRAAEALGRDPSEHLLSGGAE
jgi:uncharacterized membrane protein